MDAPVAAANRGVVACPLRGANLALVPDFIRRNLTPEDIALPNELIRSAKTYIISGVRVVISTASLG